MFEVSPESLRAAAEALALLPADISRAPALGAEQIDGKLNGSAVGRSLGRTTPLETHARDTLQARFNQLSELLAHAADTFHDNDMEVASQLAAVTDLIPTGADHGS